MLASYAAGEEPGEVARRYMQSTEFADDIGTLMYQTSLALNRRSSYLQQAPLLNEVTQAQVLFLEEVMMEVLNVVAIIVAGLMVGCELAVAVFIHPTLDKLPDDAHLPAASAIARVLGTVMPFWYNLTLLLTLAEVVIRWRQSGRLPVWIGISAVLWMLAIVYTLIVLVPVNNRIKSWEKSTPPPDWKTYRRRWDMHHRWRVVLLTMAFAFLIVGLISK